jgi:hypothetical protein
MLRTKGNGDQINGLEAHRRVPDSEELERGIAFNGLPVGGGYYATNCNT